VNDIELEFEENRLLFNLKQGAAITHLNFGKDKIDQVISPRAEYHYQSAILFPFPNRLARGTYTFEGKTYQFPLNDFGLPNALHGFVDSRHFELIDQGKDTSGAWATVKLNDHGENRSYPFPFKLTVNYLLLHKELNLSITVENTGTQNMPFGIGWHPYFNLPQGIVNAMKLPASRQVEVDQNQIPTGKKAGINSFNEFRTLTNLKLDTCFEVNAADKYSTFVTLDKGRTLEVWQGSEYPFIQIFTPEGGETIAIEPMSCNINALNSLDGIQVLAPNKNMVFRCGVKLF
jgi:aldose 1-epimerase